MTTTDLDIINTFSKPDQLFQIMEWMREPKSGVSIKDRKKNFTTYKQTIIGRELVDWIVLQKAICQTRAQAIIIGNLLIQNKLLFPVKKESTFKDDIVFYQIANDNSMQELGQRASSADLHQYERDVHKIGVLGVESSGKSTLCKQFCEGDVATVQSIRDSDANTETDYGIYRKEDFQYNGSLVRIEMLDSPRPLGAEFESNLVKWNEWANGYTIVFNIASRASFDAIPKLYNHIVKIRSFRLTPIVLIGNKLDLRNDRTVSEEEALNLAKLYRCKYVEISALTGENVTSAITEILEEITKINSNAKGPSNYKSGWLKMKKEGGQYKKRYFVATESGLRYYNQEPDSLSDITHLRGVIPMQNCWIGSSFVSIRNKRSPSDVGMTKVLESSGHKKIVRKNSDVGGSAGSQRERLKIYLMDHNDEGYYLLCSNLDDRDDWFDYLSRTTERANQFLIKSSKSETDSPHEDRTQSGQMTPDELRSHSINMFNRNPKRGMKMLLENKFLSHDPVEIAKFLKTEKHLKKQSVGQYLGENNEFNVSVLAAYASSFDFQNIDFDEALRTFLIAFRLPGEAQMIDRIMSKFGERYCQCNPTAFENQDICYILSFSLIMLNTDAHNPSVPLERKMKKDQFVWNLRGINSGKDLEQSYLEKLYDKIVSKPLEMDYERDEFVQWDKQGYVFVKESRTKDPTISSKKMVKVGKKYWCIISAGCLYIFEAPQDKKPLFIIPLSNLQIDSLLDNEESELSGFVLYSPENNGWIKCASQGGVEVLLKEIVFHYENRKTKYEWMLTFQLNLITAPNYK